jgi:hypothetical protein
MQVETGINSDSLVISVRQPWAWLIINAGKDIENRDWSTKRRGRVLIHASKSMTRDEYEWAKDFCNIIRTRHAFQCHFPNAKSLEHGGIIGSVEIVDCVTNSDSPWFQGRYGFVLRDPQPLPFYPCRGQLGFFRIDTGKI